MPDSKVTVTPRRGLSNSLLAIATLTPITLGGVTGAMGAKAPDWLAAVITSAALLGALVLLWRQRQMRGGYLVAFVGAVAIAAAVGWWGGVAS